MSTLHVYKHTLLISKLQTENLTGQKSKNISERYIKKLYSVQPYVHRVYIFDFLILHIYEQRYEP